MGTGGSWGGRVSAPSSPCNSTLRSRQLLGSPQRARSPEAQPRSQLAARRSAAPDPQQCAPTRPRQLLPRDPPRPLARRPERGVSLGKQRQRCNHWAGAPPLEAPESQYPGTLGSDLRTSLPKMREAKPSRWPSLTDTRTHPVSRSCA